MVQDIQGGINASSYVAALQDRLGNNGASVTIHNGLATLQGVALGLSKNFSATIPRVADVVSLSPTAQEFLSNSSIALALLTAGARQINGKVGSVGTVTPSEYKSSPSPVTQVASIQPSITVDGGEVTNSSDGNSVPQLSASQVLDGAIAQESNPSFVYDIINANKDFYTQTVSGDARTSFISALSDKTLNIESTSSITGLNYNQTVVITGTSESFIGAGTYNSNVLKSRGDNGFITSDAFGGSFYVSWNDKPTSTT